jgi:hypothetical protein
VNADAKRWLFLLILFSFSAMIRLVYVHTVEIDRPIRADAEKYVTLAQNIVEYRVYSHVPDAAHHDTFITPGYPLFLAAFFAAGQDLDDVYPRILTAQALLSALTVGVLLLISTRVLPFAWAAIVGLLAAVSPHAITFSGYLLTETLFTFLLSLGVYSAIRLWSVKTLPWAFAFAAFIAIAALVRPAVLLFPLLALPLLLAGSRFLGQRLRVTVTMFLTILIIWGPWHVFQSRNTSDGGDNSLAATLALGSYPNLVYQSEQMKGFPYREDPQWPQFSTNVRDALATIAARAAEEPLRYIYWYAVGKPSMFFEWSILVGQGGPFVYPVLDSLYHRNQLAYYSFWLSASLHRLWVALYFVLFLYLLGKRLLGHPLATAEIAVIPLVAIVAYFAAVHAVLAPLPRYSVPLHGLLYVAGVFFIHRLAGLARERFKRP